MKRYRIGRAALATMMSLAVGLGLTACSRDYTVAFVYAVSSQTGTVSAFASDFQSGSLVQIAGSPFASNLTNPISVVSAPNGKFIYVIGGSQDNKVLLMAVGTDGKLYGKNTYSITGSSPTSATVDPSGSFLYVTFKYQNGFTPASPGPGGVTIFPIVNKAGDATDGTLGTPVTQLVGNNPVGVAASAKSPYVYVLDADVTNTGTGLGQILGFSQDKTTGALTTVPGTTITTVAGKTVATGTNAGTTPTAIVEDPTSRFVYVTDRATNQLYGYLVSGNTSPGTLIPMTNGPFTTGLYPIALTIDPRGKYLYAVNFGASTLSSYAIDSATGNPAGVVGTGNSNIGGTGPTCVTIEPALGIYLFTSNQISATISGQQLDPHNGSLKAIENSPYDAGPLLSCVTAVANGEHASSLVNP